MKTNNNSKFLFLDYIAVAIIVIVFFVISYCGFLSGDDIWMSHSVFSLADVFAHTKNWYFTFGGRLFSVASQYLLCGLLSDNRIWFASINTLFFVLLLITCGKLIGDSKKGIILNILTFALLFWFLCPEPGQSLFWAAGTTTYLWANALTFVFLLFFQKFKDDNFTIIGKLGLFFMSVLAASEFITCASICGAFVVYYVFHFKEFKGNVIPFVIGFVIGSIILLFAPGNFLRSTQNIGTQSLFDIKTLLQHPFCEIVKYKALWMFLVVMILGWISNKKVVNIWVKRNSILLLSLGWSIIAFSVVFRPENRALFYTETLSLVLFLKFLFDNSDIVKIRYFDEFLRRNRTILIGILFVVFMVDSVFAIKETKKMRAKNDIYMKEIADSGSVGLDKESPSHRMAYASYFHKYTNETLADKYGLDSIRFYPFYCREQYYKNLPFDNVYIDDRLFDGTNIFEKKYIRMIVRIKNEKLQKPNNHVVFTIDYTRPRKWYKSWLDKLRNYQYDRTDIVERDTPDVSLGGYCYYVIWFGRGNVKGLKSIKYEIE